MPDYTTVFVVLSRIIECVYFFWSQIQPDNSFNSLTTSSVFLEKRKSYQEITITIYWRTNYCYWIWTVGQMWIWIGWPALQSFFLCRAMVFCPWENALIIFWFDCLKIGCGNNCVGSSHKHFDLWLEVASFGYFIEVVCKIVKGLA